MGRPIGASFKIIRDVEAEEKEEEFRIRHPPKTPDPTSSKEANQSV